MDVAVALEDHELVDTNRARLTHTSEVIAFEIDQHDVFRPLLGMPQQGLGEQPVVHDVDAAGSGAGDRAGLDSPRPDADEPLGRGADDPEVAEVGKARKGGRIRPPQALVEGLVRRQVAVYRPLSRQVDLKDIAFADVTVDLRDGVEIALFRVFRDLESGTKVRTEADLGGRGAEHIRHHHVRQVVPAGFRDEITATMAMVPDDGRGIRIAVATGPAVG